MTEFMFTVFVLGFLVMFISFSFVWVLNFMMHLLLVFMLLRMMGLLVILW